MNERRKQFKRVPKKYQPAGLTILYEDRDILVVDKISGLLTVSSEKVRENTAYYRLTDYVRKGNRKSAKRIFIVHRLDRDTSGLIVFAKSEKSKHFLQEEWHGFQKIYTALVHGAPVEKKGIITSYLAENRFHKMYSVTDSRKGKLARTGYKVVQESDRFSLLEVDLLTGKKNQIRVHMADLGFPVAGDKKYGTGDRGIKRLMLHALSITLRHPHTKEKMTFEAELPVYFNELVERKK
ncbi:MAG: RluA family pseudouridine synthase [Deltaproteobacteria bacterium]|nr:RluA family pseudouridine synthase [Deltaproteobacteria bacterium]MBW2659332.1 RluA family pseudouridine synthase [Deltaproteobacteria bacterium]